MTDKDKTILIRLSRELSDSIEHWSENKGTNKSALIRHAVQKYIHELQNDNNEVLELIRAIIITKLDRIQEAYNEGKIIVFSRIVNINSMLNCTYCFDEENREYVVYGIFQTSNQTMMDAINCFAAKLYKIWGVLDNDDKKRFVSDLQNDNVYFSMKAVESGF